MDSGSVNKEIGYIIPISLNDCVGVSGFSEIDSESEDLEDVGIICTPLYDCVSESVNERMLVRANVKAEVRPREGSRADLSHYQCPGQQHLTLNIIYQVTDRLIYTKLNLEPNKNLLTFRNTRSGDLIQTPWISITYWLCYF